MDNMNHDFDKNLKLSFHGIQKQIVEIQKKGCKNLSNIAQRQEETRSKVAIHKSEMGKQRGSTQFLQVNYPQLVKKRTKTNFGRACCQQSKECDSITVQLRDSSVGQPKTTTH
jgi:hypothetical protein